MNLESMSRRRLCAALAATFTVAGCSSSPRSTPTVIAPIPLPTVTASPAPGKLLIAREGNFFLFDLGNLQTIQITHFPTDNFASSPSLSPDRKSVAYTFYVLPTNQNDLGGSDLSLMSIDGTNSHVLMPHGTPGVSFEEPCWTADGKAIVAAQRTVGTDQGKTTGTRVAIVRVGLDGSGPTTLVEGGQSPNASPDGKHLAYMTANQAGVTTRLWLADAEGKGAQDLLKGQGFTSIRGPRFSPDSSRIAFGAVGGPIVTAPGGARSATGGASTIRSLFGPTVAEAHGIPWEIWTVRPDGSDLRRLTHVQEDSPVPAWSPDGKWIAFAGEVGLYLVDTSGQRTVRLSTSTSGGGIAWI
jgi:Tol biopolymer transport system component